MRTPLPHPGAQPARCFLPLHGAQLARWSHPPRGSKQGLPPSPSSCPVEARSCRRPPGVPCPAQPHTGQCPPTGRGAPSGWGPAQESFAAGHALTPPWPGPPAVGRRCPRPGIPEVPGPGWALALQSLCSPAPWSPAQAASSLRPRARPAPAPAPPEPSGDPVPPPGPSALPSAQPSLWPTRPGSPGLARPHPRPLASGRVLLPAQGTGKVLALPKTPCALRLPKHPFIFIVLLITV